MVRPAEIVVPDIPVPLIDGGDRLNDAIVATKQQLAALADDTGRRLGAAEAGIFKAQAEFLSDTDLVVLACQLMVEVTAPPGRGARRSAGPPIASPAWAIRCSPPAPRTCATSAAGCWPASPPNSRRRRRRRDARRAGDPGRRRPHAVRHRRARHDPHRRARHRARRTDFPHRHPRPHARPAGARRRRRRRARRLRRRGRRSSTAPARGSGSTRTRRRSPRPASGSPPMRRTGRARARSAPPPP